MSSTLADLLRTFPGCRVTIASSRPRPRKPREGDRKLTKHHGWLIRRQQVSRYPNGRIEGYCVRNGRPVYEWVRESSLDPAEAAALRAREGTADLTRKAAA